MTEFSPWVSGTNPLLYPWIEHNNMLDHGLEKTAAFIIRKNGVYYECLVGGTSSLAGTIFYGGSDNTGGVDGTDGRAVAQASGDATSILYGGGVVFIKEGTFTFDDAVTISAKNSVYFKGSGAGTIITQSDASDNTHFFNWLNCTYGGISDVYMNGNGGTQTGGTSAVCINGTSNKIRVNNCYIAEMYDQGILIGGTASHNYIIGNWLNDCDNNGISLTYAGATAGYNVITNNTSYDTQFAVGTVLADHNTIANNIFRNNAADTLNEPINLERSCYNLVANNQIVGSGDAGIVVHDGAAAGYSLGNRIIGNEVSNCAFMGIHLADYSGRNIVSGNYCWNNNQDDDQVNKYAGIEVDGSHTSHNLITGNICTDSQTGVETQTFGIKIHTSADYNIVKANDCNLNLDAPYSVAGYNNSYDGTVRSSTSADLSGGATLLPVFHSKAAAHLARATLLYTEVSSADIDWGTIEIGKETDQNYYYDGVPQASQAVWFENTLTLLKNDIAAGDTLTFYSGGGKTGTGEIMLIIDYLVGA